MNKKIDSDYLKQVLADAVGGQAADWKPVFETTTPDGVTERKFQNAHIGSMVIYTDADGIHRDGGGTPLEKHEREKVWKLEEEANAKFQKQMTNAASKPGDEAAAARLASLLSYEDEKFTFKTDLDEQSRIIAELSEKAGRTLAKHFIFALICDEEYDAPQVIITSNLYWKKNGCCDDQTPPVEHLLPKGFSNDMDSTWGWYGNKISAVDLCKKLQKAGFVWDCSFQDFIDNKLTQVLSDGLSVNQAKKSDKKQEPKP